MRGHALSPRGELVRDRTFRTEQRDAGGFASVNLSIFSSSKQAGTASPEPTFIQKGRAAPWVGPLHFSAPHPAQGAPGPLSPLRCNALSFSGKGKQDFRRVRRDQPDPAPVSRLTANGVPVVQDGTGKGIGVPVHPEAHERPVLLPGFPDQGGDIGRGVGGVDEAPGAVIVRGRAAQAGRG